MILIAAAFFLLGFLFGMVYGGKIVMNLWRKSERQAQLDERRARLPDALFWESVNKGNDRWN